MNNILKTFCIGTVFACGISSCSSDIETINRESGDEVVFNASADLRATATKWDAGDRIGVYMKTTGTTLTGTALSGATANVSYTTTAGNGFSRQPATNFSSRTTGRRLTSWPTILIMPTFRQAFIL